MPNDLDPASGNRLPLPRREDLDAAGQKIFDQIADPNGVTLRGLRGPGGIQLHSPRIAEMLRPLNNYLRNQAGLSGRIREVAILAAARASDSQFEWAAHEREAVKEGVPDATLEAIKNNGATAALDPVDAMVIELCRGAFVTRRVSSELYARALQQFGRRQLVDLVALIGYYVMTAGILVAFDMQLDARTMPPLPIPGPKPPT